MRPAPQPLMANISHQPGSLQEAGGLSKQETGEFYEGPGL